MLTNRALHEKINPTYLSKKFYKAHYITSDPKHWTHLCSHPEIAALTRKLKLYENYVENHDPKELDERLKQVLPLFCNVEELEIHFHGNSWYIGYLHLNLKLLNYNIKKLSITQPGLVT